MKAKLFISMFILIGLLISITFATDKYDPWYDIPSICKTACPNAGVPNAGHAQGTYGANCSCCAGSTYSSCIVFVSTTEKCLVNGVHTSSGLCSDAITSGYTPIYNQKCGVTL